LFGLFHMDMPTKQDLSSLVDFSYLTIEFVVWFRNHVVCMGILLF
jgi:hypothetical protein